MSTPILLPSNDVYTDSLGRYVAECYDSPTHTKKSGAPEVVTHLRACKFDQLADAGEAVDAWIATYRPSINGLYPDEYQWTPLGGDGIGWDVQVTYRVPQVEGTANLVECQFSTSGGSEKVYYSRNTMVCKDITSGTDTLDEGGAVGVKEDGTIEGVDTKSPAMTWTQTQNFSLAEMTAAKRQMFAEYTNCVNSAIYRGYQPGEVMFDGVSGSLQTRYNKTTNAPTQYWKLSFTFSVKRNRRMMYDGALFTARGWDHTWVKWGKVVNANGEIVNAPLKVLSDQVYPYVDLNNLGLVEIP